MLELERDTATPPAPAGVVKFIVPVADWPLTIVDGLTETLLKAKGGGLISTLAVLLVPE